MKTIQELADWKEQILKSEQEFGETKRVQVQIAMSTCGITAGAKVVLEELKLILKEKQIIDVEVSQTGCPGLCFSEPLVSVFHVGEKGRIYGNIKKNMVERIVEEDIIKNQPIKEWLINREG